MRLLAARRQPAARGVGAAVLMIHRLQPTPP